MRLLGVIVASRWRGLVWFGHGCTSSISHRLGQAVPCQGMPDGSLGRWKDEWGLGLNGWMGLGGGWADGCLSGWLGKYWRLACLLLLPSAWSSPHTAPSSVLDSGNTRRTKSCPCGVWGLLVVSTGYRHACLVGKTVIRNMRYARKQPSERKGSYQPSSQGTNLPKLAV